MFGDTCSYSSLLIKFRDQALYLSNCLGLVSYMNHRRFSPKNTIQHMVSIFACSCVDTIPVVVSKPEDSRRARAMYSGKCKDTIVKFQVMCDHSGNPIHWIGPFEGLKYDGHIFNDNHESYNLWDGRDGTLANANDVELVIGDNHYMDCHQCQVPCSKTLNRPFSKLETSYNTYLGNVRSTIEQVQLNTNCSLCCFLYYNLNIPRCSGMQSNGTSLERSIVED